MVEGIRGTVLILILLFFVTLQNVEADLFGKQRGVNLQQLQTSFTASEVHASVGETIGAHDFIDVDRMRLRDSTGRQNFISGMNYWSCMNLASGNEFGGNFSRLTMEMDQMAKSGINHLRVMAASEGSKIRQPNRIYPALQTSPGIYNEGIFIGLDRCIAEAGRRGFRLTMTLGNTWQWTGGISQIISWSRDDEHIPYPSAWDLSLPPQRSDGHPGWGNFTYAPYRPFMEYIKAFYGNKRSQKMYRDHITVILNRRNTVSGRIYKEDPTIMAWEPLNEPQVTSDTYSDPDPKDAMVEWHNQIVALLKRDAPKQLVTTGFEGKQGQKYFEMIGKSPDVDYTCIHLWVQNWERYNMLDPSRDNVERAISFAQEYMDNATRWTKELEKPVFLEEFGFPRNNWENDVVTKGDYQYSSKANVTRRDEYFQAVIAEVVQSFKKGTGFIGSAPWSYAGLFRPEEQEMNNAGVIIAGDPPQEPPGWYSIYDKDQSTLALIKQQAEEAKAWVESMNGGMNASQ